MPIAFEVFNEASYFESKFIGIIDDDVVLEKYREFLVSSRWNPRLNELVDLSDGDLSELTTKGIIELQKLVENHFIKNNVGSLKTAFYVPNDLAFGLTRIYAAYASESPENTKHFRNKTEAEKWLRSEE